MPLFVLDSPELVGLWRQIGGIAFCGPEPACDASVTSRSSPESARRRLTNSSKGFSCTKVCHVNEFCDCGCKLKSVELPWYTEFLLFVVT